MKTRMNTKLNHTDFYIEITETNTKVCNSFKLVKPSEVSQACADLREILIDLGIQPKRSIKSWTEEWFAHSVLYLLGIAKEHTQDTDLNEDESKFRLIGYHIIYIMFVWTRQIVC